MYNYQKIVKYNNLRTQFTPEELAFADALYGANESERELLVESLQPQQVKKKPGRKVGGIRCAHVYESGVTCNRMAATVVHNAVNHVDYHQFQPPTSSAKKSARAQSLAEQVQKRSRPVVGGFADDANMARCIAQIEDNGGPVECGKPADDNIHHLASVKDYHSFQPARGTSEQAEVASGN